jgi:hypothetical protein
VGQGRAGGTHQTTNGTAVLTLDLFQWSNEGLVAVGARDLVLGEVQGASEGVQMWFIGYTRRGRQVGFRWSTLMFSFMLIGVRWGARSGQGTRVLQRL